MIIKILASDTTKVLKCIKAYIYTKHYKKQLKKFEFHMPAAAKIFVHSENASGNVSVITYILFRPLIKVDLKGNAEIHISRKYDDVVFTMGNQDRLLYLINDDKEVSKKDIKRHIINNKYRNRYFESKAFVGLSVEEMVEYDNSVANIEMEWLLKNSGPKSWGGVDA